VLLDVPVHELLLIAISMEKRSQEVERASPGYLVLDLARGKKPG
jgi:hypothetical protein